VSNGHAAYPKLRRAAADAGRNGRIPNDCRSRHTRRDLFQQFKPFCADAEFEPGEPGCICGTGSMTTIGHAFIPLDREHDGMVPTGEDRAHFESLPVPLALWPSFEECLSEHLSELSEGQIDRDEKFWF
jgi:hypothetical protein